MYFLFILTVPPPLPLLSTWPVPFHPLGLFNISSSGDLPGLARSGSLQYHSLSSFPSSAYLNLLGNLDTIFGNENKQNFPWHVPYSSSPEAGNRRSEEVKGQLAPEGRRQD